MKEKRPTPGLSLERIDLAVGAPFVSRGVYTNWKTEWLAERLSPDGYICNTWLIIASISAAADNSTSQSPETVIPRPRPTSLSDKWLAASVAFWSAPAEADAHLNTSVILSFLSHPILYHENATVPTWLFLGVNSWDTIDTIRLALCPSSGVTI